MDLSNPGLFSRFDDTDSVLATYPLMIAGMIRELADGDGGVNIAVLTGHPAGMLCNIDPYSGMQAGDRHDIYWGDLKIYEKEVLPEEVDNRLLFYIPTTDIVSGWVEEVYYQITRNGSTTPDDKSAPLRVLVKLNRPGGPDKRPFEAWHSELKAPQLPDDVIKNGVDAEWAKNGIPITVPTYPEITARDTVRLKWGTVFAPALRITEQQAAGTEAITITIDQATVLAGGDSNALPVRYEVYDEVFNFCEKWSAITPVNVDAGAWRLLAPLIVEALNGVIDLDQLNRGPVTLQIDITPEYFETDDTLEVSWVGTRPSSSEPVNHKESVTIVKGPDRVQVKVPYEIVKAIAMGSADASYVLIKANGAPPLSSKHAFATVRGKISNLPAPTISEVIGETLEPSVSRATVHIRYLEMTDGDLISLVWSGTRANGNPYLHEVPHTVTAGETRLKHITLLVENAHITPLDGGTLDLFYRVSNDLAQARRIDESDYLSVKVGTILATLPAPLVDETQDGVLDPALVPRNATLRIPYLGTAKGDELTYYWRGISPVGTTTDRLPITTGLVGKPLTFRIDAQFIKPNMNQQVEVRYTLKRAATGEYETSELLLLIVGTLIGELPAPEVKEADGNTLNPIKALTHLTVKIPRYATMETSDRLSATWTGTPGQGSFTSPERQVRTIEPKEVEMPTHLVPFNLDRDVVVTYNVKRYVQSKASDPLNLHVQKFSLSDLPTPKVTQAPDDQVLELAAFIGDATTTLAKWPHSAEGQKVWLHAEGTSNGSLETITLYDGKTITQQEAEQGLSTFLTRQWLLQMTDKSTLTLIAKVAFDGGDNPDLAQEFPRLVLTLLQVGELVLIPPSVDGVVGNAFDPFILPASGAVVKVPRYGGMAVGDTVFVSWRGAPGSGSHITDPQVLQKLGEMSFSVPKNVAIANAGRSVLVVYHVTRAEGGEKRESPPYTFNVVVELRLGPPTVTGVVGGILDPDRVPASGVPVTIPQYQGMAIGDMVRVKWTGEGGSGTTLPVRIDSLGSRTVNVDRALAINNRGYDVTVTYLVTRVTGGPERESPAAAFKVLVPQVFNTNPVTLSGKAYVLRDYPTTHPALTAGISVRYQASGGQPGYRYVSSNTGVAVVDASGLVVARGRGSATITAMDSFNQSKSYTVTVTNVIQCIGLGSGTWAGINAAANAHGVRIPSFGELEEIHAAYGGRWPMGDHHYWSTTDHSDFRGPQKRCHYLARGSNINIYVRTGYSLGVGIR
ncbi:Ig-like domain-containing protein [Pseudomonas sp. PMCC200344]|uniref:Ig-like domain-containing protein n=1 Tax=Pseudomonas sp. PMCC200344 TaxID=3042028 RepID=UPI0024B38FA9|nr:Ig-like domain-containing protein [Pseudomonas sp. PMCC200344]